MSWTTGYMSIAELKKLPLELLGVIFLGDYESSGKHLYVIVGITHAGLEGVQIDRIVRTRGELRVKQFSDNQIIWLPDQQYGRGLYPQSWALLATRYTFISGGGD